MFTQAVSINKSKNTSRWPWMTRIPCGHDPSMIGLTRFLLMVSSSTKTSSTLSSYWVTITRSLETGWTTRISTTFVGAKKVYLFFVILLSYMAFSLCKVVMFSKTNKHNNKANQEARSRQVTRNTRRQSNIAKSIVDLFL